MQPAMHPLLQAIRDRSRGRENASSSFSRTLRKLEDSTGGQGKTNADASNDCTKINKPEEGVFDMFRGILTLTLSLGLGAAAALAQAAAPINEQEAHAIAVDAYVYFYPLLSMDVSRKQFTNGTTDFKGPMNTLSTCPNTRQQISKASCGPTSIRCIPSHGWT
jgi:hypothetical protein